MLHGALPHVIGRFLAFLHGGGDRLVYRRRDFLQALPGKGGMNDQHAVFFQDKNVGIIVVGVDRFGVDYEEKPRTVDEKSLGGGGLSLSS